MLHTYYPELNESKPEDTEIEVKQSSTNKYRLVTALILEGRGISHHQTYTAKDLVPQAQHKVGWHVYYVTPKAMETLIEKHIISRELLLD